MAYAMRLAKAGYWGGDPGRVLRAPVDEVVKALHYEGYAADCERTYYEMNKERRD